MKKNEVLAVTIAGIALCVAYLCIEPYDSPWLPACPLFHLTGWQCPLCGAQRMAHAMLHGRLVQAWHYNAALLLSLPYCFLLLLCYLWRDRYVKAYHTLFSSRAMLLYCMVAIVWGIARNVY